MCRSIAFPFLILLMQSPRVYGGDLTNAMLMVSKGSDLTRNERISISNSFNNECKKLLRLVLILSPKESQWLDNEINSGTTGLIYKTPEFSKRALHNLFTTCVDGTTHIRNANNSVDEALGWSILLSAIGEMDVDYFMRNSGVRELSNKSEETASTFRLTSVNISRNILIPLLKENINKRVKSDAQ